MTSNIMLGMKQELLEYSSYTCKCMTILLYTLWTDDVSETIPVEVKHLKKEMSGCSLKIHTLSLKLTEQDSDICALREELRKLLNELAETRIAMRDIVDKLTQLDTP